MVDSTDDRRAKAVKAWFARHARAKAPFRKKLAARPAEEKILESLTLCRALVETKKAARP